MKPDFCFTAPAPAITGDPERKTRTFSGVAHSGALVARGPFGRMGVDLEGARFLPRTPVLLDHDPSARVGHATLSYRDGALFADGTLLKNTRASDLAADSDDGFPWQMSIYADPESVQDIPAGAAFTLNGKTEQGPATLLMRPLIRELSFTPMGADHQTPVQVLNHQRQEARDVATDNEAMARLTAEIAELNTKLTAATAKAEELSAALTAAQAERDAAAAALSAERTEVRKADVVATFTALGKQDIDAAPYLAMPQEAWAAVKKDLSAFTARTGNDYLFRDEANGGVDPLKAKAALITQMASA